MPIVVRNGSNDLGGSGQHGPLSVEASYGHVLTLLAVLATCVTHYGWLSIAAILLYVVGAGAAFTVLSPFAAGAEPSAAVSVGIREKLIPALAAAAAVLLGSVAAYVGYWPLLGFALGGFVAAAAYVLVSALLMQKLSPSR